eukprot:XP_015582859.1 uncharacterized protein LOC107262301 [Ricinus communis]
MENLLHSKEYWKVVDEGFTEPAAGSTPTAEQTKALEEIRLKDFKAKNYLFSSIDKTILKTITKKGTAKELWKSMKTKFQGSAGVKRAQLQALRREFEVLKMKEGETINDYFGRVMIVSNSMRNCGELVEEVKIVEKILRTLMDKCNYVVCSIEESKNLDELTVDELQSSLLVHEQKLVRKTVTDDQALRVRVGYGRGRSRGRGNYQEEVEDAVVQEAGK